MPSSWGGSIKYLYNRPCFPFLLFRRGAKLSADVSAIPVTLFHVASPSCASRRKASCIAFSRTFAHACQCMLPVPFTSQNRLFVSFDKLISWNEAAMSSNIYSAAPLRTKWNPRPAKHPRRFASSRSARWLSFSSPPRIFELCAQGLCTYALEADRKLIFSTPGYLAEAAVQRSYSFGIQQKFIRDP